MLEQTTSNFFKTLSILVLELLELRGSLFFSKETDAIFREPYDELVDELMFALKNRWPDVLIQFEDFSNNHAYPLLHKYRLNHTILSLK